MKLLFLVFSMILISNVLSSPKLDKSFILEKFMDKPKELFKAFYTLFNKDAEYDINSELGIQKYKVFKSKVEIIKEENKKRGVQVYGITQFTDLTDEEFKNKYLMKPETLREMGINDYPSPSNADDVEDSTNWPSIDWRGYLNPVRDQLGCGSCWAFAAVSAVEGAYNIEFNELLSLSEQFLVDCNELDDACKGGWPSRTFTWMASNGVVDASEVKYRANKGNCSSFKKRNAKNIVSGFDFCDGNCTNEKWIELLSKGPMIVAMDGFAKNLSIYKPISIDIPYNPIDDKNVDTCTGINHAVVAVGIRHIAGTPHIIVRNSWGTGWGYEGYFSISIENPCFILRHAWRPNVKQHSSFVPGPEFSKFYNSCDANAVAQPFEFGVSNSQQEIGGPIRGVEFGSMFRNFFAFANPDCKGTSSYIFHGLNSTNYKCFANNRTWKTREFQSAFVQTTLGTGCVWFYDKSCYNGNWARLCGNEPDLSSLNFDLSKVQSIRMGGLAGNKCNINNLFFFEETGYKGKMYGLPYAREFYLNNDTLATVVPFIQNAKSIYFDYTPGCQ